MLLAQRQALAHRKRVWLHAPQLRFHPSEKHRCIEPNLFIRLSRFRNHRGRLKKDRGYNKRTKRWKISNSHDKDFYNIPVAFINSFGLTADGKNRIPRNPNATEDWQVFLEPKHRPAGPDAPDSKVPAYYLDGKVGKEYRIMYWWFMSFNDSPGGAMFDHEGDWERVTVAFDESMNFKGAYYHQHKNAVFVDAKKISYVGPHPIVYVAKGTHASYERTGDFGKADSDKARDGGVRWNTWTRFLPLRVQPWKDYAGAWGEVGVRSGTTGVAGPYIRGLKVKGA